ncbi:bifunctional [glutamate--ammonia ligase]-adenylyl-L-tyrosine phosphorylase/[glutamate--ammonia-ligase] adenylyltransferase [Aestuariirhabdus sp. Z084]|uniref:bifunctional [glutamate--ammonia ligase]-adenylyl-L-tyrosine phosphorylase/[glutamate--ammonia-ligase] adenylyltransferase n=1 Tax=Aestuariirhabdus haliotis TaxID=2918751 RepID=UPI00201B397C|nr:bifunctional [glutamate--ammonia ligase]-adenylyl-L-tyrosine phosphorylase/[glutamate--ammonia-ligase] adenylyltransferase [Aestuariirhabdus haliotis]MCL6415586.1 bifunctional [glutamate--ammonia ligase]-adenylyl-L-tyrosine phosphorylase/[glutamate--ammonia-ligase] adenylyltransferase [Aestuariirhabdus haliotis]MCL6419581.1 bifunctional [glutamate--ammonia ligase]-adenylyl-L-tyrosine phosphorylase/[glutamate--ammonia-ligase] adenylyltransferase [Aestuariirhabdus haliotis]
MELDILQQQHPLIVEIVGHQWQAFQESREARDDCLKQLGQNLQESDRFAAELVRCWGGSDYVAELCRRRPELLLELMQSGDLQRSYSETEHRTKLDTLLQSVTTEDELGLQLRRFRQREQLRIIWRDLNRLADVVETTADLSAMADAAIDGAYVWLYESCTPSWGVPMGADADEPPWPQHLIVLGMGKLGACELNLSSDIDLIFAYPNQGETQGGRRSLTNQEFFIRLGQKLIKALDALTVEGFVFRVDMRLRPYGQSGALVLSFDAMEQYYQDQGRDWERYAMIKARVVAGDRERGSELLAMLKPFVYRRYIDFSAVDALRDMKRMIQTEVKRKGMQENVKLGAGGIREIEFIGQAFQLIHGGRERALQQRPIMGVLRVLKEKDYLPEEAVEQLVEAYRFLRNVEHALQALDDKQTQNLPEEDSARLRLALTMGFDTWEQLQLALAEHREFVQKQFDEVVADPSEQPETESDSETWSLLWSRELSDEDALDLFVQAGYALPKEALSRLESLRDGRALQSVQRQGRERIDLFMPMLLSQLSALVEPDEALQRFLPLVESVMRRTAYLVLLMENRSALEQLFKLCVASPWIAERIARHPMLLDEFLDVDSLFAPPGRAQLADELRQQMVRIPADDLEQQMEALRYFKTSHVLRVAAAEIAGTLPLMKVSDYLTWIAEVVVCEVVEIAWSNMVARYGQPQSAAGEPAPRDFIVIGYGKVGGIELGYGSDLDLVFVHGVEGQQGTDGERSIDNQTFFVRLGQRIIHILNTQTASGQLYEVDMRLRPSGASGLLVGSLEAFAKYQQNDAWTWEHQALCRARVIAGSDALTERFKAVRGEVLSSARGKDELRSEVVAMRQKMRDNLGTPETSAGASEGSWQADAQFHLKQDHGGIVDIEFMVQYGVLAWSQQYPELLEYTDNIRVLDSLEATSFISSDDADLLREAYKAYRAAAHRLALQNCKGVVSGDAFHEYRRGVMGIWQRIMLDADN